MDTWHPGWLSDPQWAGRLAPDALTAQPMTQKGPRYPETDSSASLISPMSAKM